MHLYSQIMHKEQDAMHEAVAALIMRKDRFLLCQRPAHQARGGLWELAGGSAS